MLLLHVCNHQQRKMLYLKHLSRGPLKDNSCSGMTENDGASELTGVNSFIDTNALGVNDVI